MNSILGKAMRHAIAATIVVLGVQAGAFADDYHADPRKTGVVECLTDEVNGTPMCVWDAKHRGNGLGHSLIITKWRAFRVPHGIAHAAAKGGPVAQCETFLPADPPVACVYHDLTSHIWWAVSQDMHSYPLSERVALILINQGVTP